MQRLCRCIRLFENNTITTDSQQITDMMLSMINEQNVMDISCLVWIRAYNSDSVYMMELLHTMDMKNELIVAEISACSIQMIIMYLSRLNVIDSSTTIYEYKKMLEHAANHNVFYRDCYLYNIGDYIYVDYYVARTIMWFDLRDFAKDCICEDWYWLHYVRIAAANSRQFRSFRTMFAIRILEHLNRGLGVDYVKLIVNKVRDRLNGDETLKLRYMFDVGICADGEWGSEFDSAEFLSIMEYVEWYIKAITGGRISAYRGYLQSDMCGYSDIFRGAYRDIVYSIWQRSCQIE
jgi:hypothetical protein